MSFSSRLAKTTLNPSEKTAEISTVSPTFTSFSITRVRFSKLAVSPSVRINCQF